MEVILNVDAIASEYRRQGFTLTLRQMYYQFIARDILPDSWFDEKVGSKNSAKNYKRLGDIINNARLAGLVDWEAIEDRGRNLITHSAWETPAGIIRSARASYQMDHWRGQAYRPEVWIEKESLIGIIAGVCTALRVPYYTTKGYNGQSEMWRAGRRMADICRRGQIPVVFHLGDHDSSGIDMTRDNRERLELFMGGGAHLERIALNMDQVEMYNPPPNPAKESDSRYAEYVEIHGEETWELDALSPTVIADLIRNAITPLRDEDIYREVVEEEEEGRRQLKDIEDHFFEVAEFLRDKSDD
jgi:hypothetical protein